MLWLENAVTHEFLEYISQEIDSLRSQDRVAGDSIEKIAFNAIATQSQIDCIERIQNWRPEHGRD
jgi:hypothetical protein